MNNSQTRRQFLKKTIAAGTLAIASGRGKLIGNEASPKRNVLLYVTDDHGTEDAGCYGNPIIKTPGLDQLAQEGVVFTNAFCTTSSCSASRSVILAGLYNHANAQYGHMHGYNHFSSFDYIKSLPVLLKNQGYRTASIGKLHVAPNEVYRFDCRRDTFLTPTIMAEESKKFITADDTQPFFLYFCTAEPHRPFRRKGSDMIDPADVIVPDYLPDIPECREELAKYYMSVQCADRGLLTLIRILKETGHWDDTLIIYISDNGIAFPGAKTTLYEPGMRLPCVVRNPYTAQKGIATDAFITWADITPTILDFTAAPGPEYPLHGRSFLPVLENKNHTGFDEIYASHTFHEITMYYPMRVVREKRFKLIWNIAHELPYPFASDLYASDTWQAVLNRGLKQYGKRSVQAYIHRPEFELYGLQNDPHEIKNLADSPDHKATLNRLKDKIKAFQQRTNDPWILKWQYE